MENLTCKGLSAAHRRMLIKRKRSWLIMNKARRFVIETPLGKLEVYAKHDKSDCASDEPTAIVEHYNTDFEE